MTVELTPIGHVVGGRAEPIDDDWADVEATIELDPAQFSADVVAGLDDFSHLDVVFFFDRVDPSKINLSSRHPRGNTDWPKVGIFAQRAKARPNRLGVTTCDLVAVDGLSVRVRGLDAIDGTPVLDIKPHITGFQARSEVREPEWIRALMADYW